MKLAELYTSLTGSECKVRSSKLLAVRLDNVNKVLDRFKQEPKMYLDGHCADDFLNGSRKHVLSFIWQVRAGGSGARQ